MNLQPPQSQPIQSQPLSVGAPDMPLAATNGQQPELSQEEMKANIQDMMSKIDEKHQGAKAAQFAYDKQSAEAKSKALRDVFDSLQSAGIDPSDVEQVGQFIDQIKTSNPELAQQIEKVFQDLIREEMESMDQEGPTQQDPSVGETPTPDLNMNINTNDQSSQKI